MGGHLIRLAGACAALPRFLDAMLRLARWFGFVGRLDLSHLDHHESCTCKPVPQFSARAARDTVSPQDWSGGEEDLFWTPCGGHPSSLPA